MEINYTAPKTVSRFMQSQSFIRAILGPVGSGKTTGCIMELLRRACEQHPGLDGVRRTRFAICRQTLQQLKQTVLKDIAYWLNSIARWKVSENTIYFKFLDVESEWILMPLETVEDQRRLLSMNLTALWISEAIEIEFDLISPVAARAGRFPAPADGGASWYGVIIDSNMPTEGTPWHRALANPAFDWDVHIQPGGLAHNAENLEWLLQTPASVKLPPSDPARRALGRVYYERLARNNNPAWVTRYVHAMYGPDPSGSAVYAQTYRVQFHGVASLEPVRGMPLYVGQDFGRDPWGIICQPDNMGRFLVLEEVPAFDIGLRNHCRLNLRPKLLQDRYRGLSVIVVGDPAGGQRSQYDEITALDVLKAEGFSAVLAFTNDLDTRLRSVEHWLLQQRQGGPAIVFDRSRCPKLCEGMSGMYRFSKTPLDVSKPKPDKNEWSHVADALQYACLATMGDQAKFIARRLTGRHQQERRSAAGWT